MKFHQDPPFMNDSSLTLRQDRLFLQQIKPNENVVMYHFILNKVSPYITSIGISTLSQNLNSMYHLFFHVLHFSQSTEIN